MLVCTVGEFQIFPGATNVIGSRTTFSVDIRAQSDRVRKNVVQDVTRKVQLICRARGLECKFQRTHEASGVTMDRRLTKQLEDACDRTTEEMHRRAYDLYMEQQRLQREENDYNDDYNDDFGDFNDDYDGDGDEMRDEDQSDDLFYYSDAQKKKMNSKQRRRTNNKRNRNDRSGFTREPVITRPPTLVSGAGHDALAMADARRPALRSSERWEIALAGRVHVAGRYRHVRESLVQIFANLHFSRRRRERLRQLLRLTINKKTTSIYYIRMCYCVSVCAMQ